MTVIGQVYKFHSRWSIPSFNETKVEPSNHSPHGRPRKHVYSPAVEDVNRLELRDGDSTVRSDNDPDPDELYVE